MNTNINKILNYGLGLMALLGLFSCNGDKFFGDSMTEVFPISSIVINPTSYDAAGDTICMLKNSALDLTWSITPVNATNPKISWTSLDNTIAAVSANDSKATLSSGNVLGITTLNITPEIGFGNAASSPVKIIKVMDAFVFMSAISVTNAPTQQIAEESTYQLTVGCTPANTTFKRYKWVSSDNSVLTVDKKGLVTAIKTGTAVVTVTPDDMNASSTVKTSVTIGVKKIIPITDFQLVADAEAGKLGYGQDYQVNYTLTPSNATASLLTWKSSDTNVATVDANGLVHVNAMVAGTAIISATYQNITKSMNVTVAEGRLWYSFGKTILPWTLGNSATYVSDGTKATVTMGLTTKYRGDLSLVANGSGKTLTIAPAMYRYVAVKFKPTAVLVPGSNSAGTIKFEIYDNPVTIGYNNKGTVNSANNSFTLLSGSSVSTTSPNVMYYDLQGSWDTKTPTDWTTKFNLVQFKFVIADFVAPASTYDIYWVKSFKTLQELQDYVAAGN